MMVLLVVLVLVQMLVKLVLKIPHELLNNLETSRQIQVLPIEQAQNCKDNEHAENHLAKAHGEAGQRMSQAGD